MLCHFACASDRGPPVVVGTKFRELDDICSPHPHNLYALSSIVPNVLTDDIVHLDAQIRRAFIHLILRLCCLTFPLISQSSLSNTLPSSSSYSQQDVTESSSPRLRPAQRPSLVRQSSLPRSVPTFPAVSTSFHAFPTRLHIPCQPG